MTKPDSAKSAPQTQGRKILLGVTGGIAAYKTPDLVRRLVERGTRFGNRLICSTSESYLYSRE